MAGEKTFALIDLNKQHAMVIDNALDMYARIGIGQLGEILHHPAITLNAESRERAEMLIRELKLAIFGFAANASHAIGNEKVPDVARQAYDMHVVIRHHLAMEEKGWPKHRDFGAMMSWVYDEPRHLSTEQPLPTMKTQSAEAQVTPSDLRKAAKDAESVHDFLMRHDVPSVAATAYSASQLLVAAANALAVLLRFGEILVSERGVRSRFDITEQDIGRHVRQKSTGRIGIVSRDPGNNWLHAGVVYEWEGYRNDLEYVTVTVDES